MHARRFLASALLLLCCAASASADLKIKSRSSFGGQAGHEMTTYIKGKRQRAEMPGGMATVTQCDLRRTVQLNGTTKTYMVSPFDDAVPEPAAEAVTAPAPRTQTPTRRGGIVTTTVTSTDTGERKQMFGYTARRIKTTMVTESSPDACNPQQIRMETDGWYIDLKVGFDCAEQAATAYRPPAAQSGGCRDTYRMKTAGAVRTGYPVHVTTTIFDGSGRQTTMTQEVLEISQATLDTALFEVPADYREVKDYSEMYTAAAAAGRGEDADDEANTGGISARPAPSSEAGPKREGVVRIGVALTKVTAAEGLDPEQLAAAVSGALSRRLAGPTVEVVRLQSRLPQQIDAEAGQKACDYVVHLTAAHKKGGGGGFGGFLKKAERAATGAIIGGTTGGDSEDFSANIKSKDELTLQYAVQRGSGAPSAPATLKAKARADGEDLVSQLAEQAAAAVLAATK